MTTDELLAEARASAAKQMADGSANEEIRLIRAFLAGTQLGVTITHSRVVADLALKQASL